MKNSHILKPLQPCHANGIVAKSRIKCRISIGKLKEIFTGSQNTGRIRFGIIQKRNFLEHTQLAGQIGNGFAVTAGT